MIALRFDIDTYKGLIERTPHVLGLLEKHGFKATFFCVMGYEANLIDIMRLRIFFKNKQKKGKINIGKKGGIFALAKTALFPKGVAIKNGSYLEMIKNKGHEIQPHGWKHITWQRDLENLNVEEEFNKINNVYMKIFNTKPKGFAAPGRSTTQKSLEMYDKLNLLYSGDMDGHAPFRHSDYKHLQIPVTYFKTIDQMRAEGKSTRQIIDKYIGVIDTNTEYCCFYEHPDNLFDEELEVFDTVYKYISDTNRPVLTHSEIHNIYANPQTSEQ